MACGKGMILRKSYRKWYGARVKAACVKDTGAPGKGKSLKIKMKHGELTKYGYSLNNPSDRSRHMALNKAIKRNGKLKVLKKVNLLATFRKNDTRPEIKQQYRRAKKDVKFIQTKF